MVLTYHYLYAFCNECIYKVIPSTLFISILILDAIYLVLLGVTGKSNVSYLILILGLFLLFVVNQIKIIYMNEPLFFSDFNFIDQTSNLLDIIGDSFWGEIKFFLKFFGILLVICFIVMFYQSYFRFRVESGKLRIISSFCGLFIIFILFFPFSWSKSLYKDIFFDIDDYFDYYSYTDYISLYSYYDIIGGMYYQFLDNRLDIPDDYDDKKLDNILENVDDVVGQIWS